ncbi:hypothetical protein [Algoriphagus resistens]|uniref:hypothetical protein n=1 Tax=Algoriphagus resistens TaxID=1750590 RepID=UPI000AD63B32|nr:hypothetical protein [Algoriphagus resistens]
MAYSCRENDAWLRSKEYMIVWLGNAAFFLKLQGIRMPVDNVFGKLLKGEVYVPMGESEQVLNRIKNEGGTENQLSIQTLGEVFSL